MKDHRRRPPQEQSTSFRLARQPSAQIRRRNDRDKAPFFGWTRIFQWASVLAATIAAGVLTYYYLSHRLEDDFLAEFQHVSYEVKQESSHRLRNQYSFLESLSLAAAASTMNQDWPLITIPNFDTLAQNYLNQSLAQTIAFAPLVYGTNITAWNDYASGTGTTNYTYKIENGIRVQDFDSPSAPLWQISPDKDVNFIKYNLLQNSWINQLVQASLQKKQPLLSEPIPSEALFSVFPRVQSPDEETWTILAQPVLTDTAMGSSDDASNNTSGEVGGFLLSILPWSAFFKNILWHEEESVICVIRDSLNYDFSYQLIGSEVLYLGPGDSFHDPKWEVASTSFSTSSSSHAGQRQRKRQVQYASSYSYTLEVYPANTFYEYYVTDEPWIYASIVAAIFMGVALWFCCCDCFRKGRENRIDELEARLMDRSVQLGSSRFVRGTMKSTMPENNKKRMNAFLMDNSALSLPGSGEEEEEEGIILDNSTDDYDDLDLAKSKPIADFFPSATVMLADISGFTAWSSVREPSQVFVLLESTYHAFDAIAKRMKILKVETIGDCYVAVCGLPDPRPDHSLRMCQYARSCIRKFRRLSHKLEEKLGPETSALDLRIGIATGAITAGIVRGHNARFQLLGDTVWRATKIESTGEGGKIHLSKETANQLTLAGKGHWLQRRRDAVRTETGEIQTFWLLDENSLNATVPLSSDTPRRTLSQESGSGESLGDSSFGEVDGWEENNEQSTSSIHMGLLRAANEHSSDLVAEGRSKMKRLVGWNCEVILPLLKMIVARREAEKKRKGGTDAPGDVKKLERKVGSNTNVLDEVEEVINLPEFDSKVQKRVKSDLDKVQLGPEVEKQLREYVTLMASLYRDNPFHNFEHASHVTMSMTKLLGRINAPDEVMDMFGNKKMKDMASSLHDYTYGITSDPLTQFAAVMSALIHDVDHRGIPNFLLIKEDPELVAVYHNKSVAEQNSVDIAWEALMDSRFEALRNCIYANEAELKRFRQLLVNSVMATDIFDKDLSALRKKRWEKAFKAPLSIGTPEDINRKATIVIEHLIQASDVSHTMQHWHIYKKWNERLFQELYTAYRRGRSDKDPSPSWYQGELSFFDNYVIPLAKKLKDCGVFGVSSDEYLHYATANRNEWEAKGREIVEGMIDKYSLMMDVA